ncbi:MAG TPA: radical SAM protein [Vicinamibacterales bacterium]|nr:radical SAM protein [Vicinamibacterales bacterium]
MSIEVRPLGVKCNIQCQYCYQNPQRDAGNIPTTFDLPKMKAALERAGSNFTIFGGEPLLIPDHVLEELWAFGLQRFGSNGIQTNGTLINDAHVRMFKQYGVQVGISVDGPGELNDVRWAGSLESTREATAKTHAAIERLIREGLTPSLIVTLHRNNATADKLPRMVDWFRYLDTLGVTSVRLHDLEIESAAVGTKYGLTPDEQMSAFLEFAAVESELRQLRFDVFSDIRKMLLAQDQSTTCIWNGCDPYNTRAVQGVEGHGQRSNCGRTNKDGIDFVKADREGFERYLALYHTPQEVGGCSDCRFFLMCKGHCPGGAIGGDWRNRSSKCDLWKALFERFEGELIAEGLMPVSVGPHRQALEAFAIRRWSAGQSAYLSEELARLDSGVAAR